MLTRWRASFYSLRSSRHGRERRCSSWLAPSRSGACWRSVCEAAWRPKVVAGACRCCSVASAIVSVVANTTAWYASVERSGVWRAGYRSRQNCPRGVRDVRAAPDWHRSVLFSAAVSSLPVATRAGHRGLFVHNDYVQFLVEGGLPLLVLVLLVRSLHLASCRWCSDHRAEPKSPGFIVLESQSRCGSARFMPSSISSFMRCPLGSS